MTSESPNDPRDINCRLFIMVSPRRFSFSSSDTNKVLIFVFPVISYIRNGPVQNMILFLHPILHKYTNKLSKTKEMTIPFLVCRLLLSLLHSTGERNPPSPVIGTPRERAFSLSYTFNIKHYLSHNYAMTSLAAVRQLIAAEKSVVIRHTKDADGADGGTLTIGRVVLKRNDSHRCTVYELFGAKTDAFLLSCIAKDEAQGWVGYGLALAAATVGGTRAGGGGGASGGSGGSGGIIFTTLRDLDQRAYEDVSTSPFCASYLGTLVPQGWGGRTWTLFVSSDSRGDGDSRIDGARHAATSSSGPSSAVPHCTIR